MRMGSRNLDQDLFQLDIPEEIASQFRSLADLDAWVVREAETLGVRPVLVIVPSHLAHEGPGAAETGSDMTLPADVLAVGGVAHSRRNKEVCSYRSRSPRNVAASRRGVMGWFAKVLAAFTITAGFGMVLGRQSAFAHSCPLCDSSCYFDTVQGMYVRNCYWWRSGCGVFCCWGRIYWANCNQQQCPSPYTGCPA
jgi:hypothetical protein